MTSSPAFLVQRSEARARHEIAAVTVGALALTALIALAADPLTFDHPRFRLPDDHHKYIYLARNDPFGLHIAPFGWRPLVPTMARLLPFDSQSSFYSIAFVSLWLTGAGMYGLARVVGFGPLMASAGMLMFFSMGWATKFNLHDFWLTDPVAFLFITIAIYLAITGHDVTLALVLAVGVAAKESVFFVAPMHYGLHAERFLDRRAALRSMAVAAPCLLVLVSLRLAVPAMNTDPAYVSTLPDHLYDLGDAITYDFLRRPIEVIEYRLRDLSAGSVWAVTLGPCGLPALLAIVGIKVKPRWALRFLPFFAAVYAQLLYAPVNSERLLVVQFPALIIMALLGAEALIDRFGTPPWRFIAFSLVLLGTMLVGPTFMPRIRHQLVLLVVFVPFLLVFDRWLRSASKASHQTKREP